MKTGREKAKQQNKVVPLDRKRRNRKKKPKQRRKQKKLNSGAATLILLIIAAVIFLLGPTLIKTMSGSISSTEILKSGVIEESFPAKAVVIREEKALDSGMKGICINTYAEGQRVPKNATVASVIDEGAKQLADQIQSLNVRISQAKDDVLNNEGFINEELKNVDQEILRNVSRFSEMYAAGTLTDYTAVYNEIHILLDKKADLKNHEGNPTSSLIDQLTAERARIQNTLKGKMKNIINDTAGLVSYSLDGFEDSYSPAILDNISIPGYEKMLEDTAAISKEELSETAHVKIITGLHYYLVCNVKYSQVSELEQGDQLDVRIHAKNLLISMQVERIQKEGDRAIIVFQSDKALSEMTGVRQADIDIILRQVKGIMVPLKALTNINYIESKAKIALIRSGYVSYTDAKILSMNEEYAIIENFSEDAEIKFKLNDFIVIDPTKVSKGQVVN